MNHPVLVLGGGPRVGVTIARSLGRHGIPVFAAGLSASEAPYSSRAVRRYVSLPDLRRTPERFLAELRALIRTEQIDMVVPGSDRGMAAVLQYYQQLGELAHVGCPPPLIADRVLDKTKTLEAAARCGIPAPDTHVVSDIAELEGLRDALRFPLVAKTRIQPSPHHFRLGYVHSFQQLHDLLTADERRCKDLLLQEFCPGVGKGIETLMHDGEPVAMYQHRRLKELPFSGGVSVLTIAEAPDPELRKFALSLLRDLEWEGVAMVEFRCDPATGAVKLMEVNGRYWGSLASACHAGVDFPYYHWQIVHGQRPQVPSGYKVGMRARWTTGDLERLHRLLFEYDGNAVSPPARWKELIRFVTDFRFSKNDFLWAPGDSRAALKEFKDTVGELASRDARAVAGRLLPTSVVRHLRTLRDLDPEYRSSHLKLRMLRAFGRHRYGFRGSLADLRSVLFVCHGNVIRSPMAAAFVRQRFADADRPAPDVRSAGLADRLQTNPFPTADEKALLVAPEFGVSLESHRPAPLSPEVIEHTDAIFVMDHRNESMLLARYPQARAKVFLLGATADARKSEIEIADPHDGTLDDVRQCYRILTARIESTPGLPARQAARSPEFEC